MPPLNPPAGNGLKPIVLNAPLFNPPACGETQGGESKNQLRDVSWVRKKFNQKNLHLIKIAARIFPVIDKRRDDLVSFEI